MCTSIVMRSENVYFGRNMDIDYDFGQSAVITPRSFPLYFKEEKEIKAHFSMVGTAAVFENYPLYAEAMNEKGLYMSALNFPDNACYSEKRENGKHNISAAELILWVLSQCETTEEARALLEKTNIRAIPFSAQLSLTPLHWHIADESGSLCVEKTKEGLNIYDNPFDVVTNNPVFPHHKEEMWKTSLFSNKNPSFEKKEAPCGSQLGLGAWGLRGDFSSHSRFEKAFFLLNFCSKEKSENCVSQFFHILSSVAVIKGAVLTKNEKPHYTKYSCCFDQKNLTYYFKEYFSQKTEKLKLTEENMKGSSLQSFSFTYKNEL